MCDLIVSRLEKDGAGTWTITGDNSAQAWQYVAIGAGRLALASGAKFGNTSVSIGDGATLELPAGAQLPSRLSIGNGADSRPRRWRDRRDLYPVHAVPGQRQVHPSLDISAAGVDHITVGDSAGTSGGRIVFNQVGPTLTPGTYTFITCTGPTPAYRNNTSGSITRAVSRIITTSSTPRDWASTISLYARSLWAIGRQ